MFIPIHQFPNPSTSPPKWGMHCCLDVKNILLWTDPLECFGYTRSKTMVGTGIWEIWLQKQIDWIWRYLWLLLSFLFYFWNSEFTKRYDLRLMAVTQVLDWDLNRDPGCFLCKGSFVWRWWLSAITRRIFQVCHLLVESFEPMIYPRSALKDRMPKN